MGPVHTLVHTGYVRMKSTPRPKEGKAGNYSIYIIFPRNPSKDEGGMRVYAGRAVSEDEAIERACAILKERCGDAKAVEVIDWGRVDDVVVRRIDRDDRTVGQ
jgi:hypothetical protein